MGQLLGASTRQGCVGAGAQGGERGHSSVTLMGGCASCFGGGAADDDREKRANEILAANAVPRQVSVGGTTRLPLPPQTLPADHPASVNSALLHAAAHGDNEGLVAALKAGAELGARDADGRTSLMRAALGGADACVRTLLAFSADVRAGDNEGDTPLMGAAMHGHEACVMDLLRAGANVHATTKNGCVFLSPRPTPLHAHVRYARTSNKTHSNTPLHFASGTGSHETCVHRLLEAGANIEARNKNGNTPLLWAARGGNADVIAALLQAGADKAAQNSAGQDALELARTRGHAACVRQLRAAAPASLPRPPPAAGSAGTV